MNTLNGRTVAKLQATAIIAILVASSLFMFAPAFVPKASAALTGTLTLSRTKLSGNATIQISIQDPDLIANNAVGPDLKFTNTTSAGVSGRPLKLNVTQQSDGSWVAYITNGLGTGINATAAGSNSEANGLMIGSNARRYVQNPPALMTGRYGTLNGIATWGTVAGSIIQVLNFTSKDTLTFTYNDATGAAGAPVQVSQAITFDNDKGTVRNNRDVIGPLSVLFPTMTDQDFNRDPTKADSFKIQATFIVTSSNTTGGVSGTNTSAILLTFRENGLNTNMFELNSTAITGGALITNNTQLKRGGAILPRAVADGDLFAIRFTDPNPPAGITGTSAQLSHTMTISRKLGVMSLSRADLRYSNFVTITITDYDANINPSAKDTITIQIRVNTTTGSSTELRLTESDKNSTSFGGRLSAGIGNRTGTAGVSVSSTNVTRATLNVQPGDKPVVSLTYSDASAGLLTTSNATVPFAFGTASLALDKTSYAPSDLEAIVTLKDSDLNTSGEAQQSLLIRSGANSTVRNAITGGNWRTGYFFVVVINGTSVRQEIRDYITNTIETSLSSGTWTFSIPLSSLRAQLNGLTSTDSLRVSYKRLFDNVVLNATATIGGVVATIKFDRGALPVPVGRRANFTVFVADPDLNQNPNAAETMNARIYVRNATDGVVGNAVRLTTDTSSGSRLNSYYNVTLTETGSNTGNFSLKLFINWGATETAAAVIGNYSNPTKATFNLDTTRDMVGGRIQVAVTDGLGPSTLEAARVCAACTAESVKGVTAALAIGVSGASIATNVTSGKVGVAVKFTLTEPDMNQDPAEVDKVSVRFAITKGIAIPSEDTLSAPLSNDTMVLTETGANTGVFTNSTRLGTGTTPFNKVNASQFVTVRYQDDAAPGSIYSVGLVKAKASASVVIRSTTGVLTTSVTETGPFSRISVTLVDPDRAYNRTGDNVVLAKITSESISDEITSRPSIKFNRTTSTFTFNFTTTYATVANTADALLQVNATDKIHIFYNDALDDNGNVRVVEKIITVLTRDGTIKTDKANYLVGELITITITDIDRNVDPDVRDFVRPVVTTDSWTSGTNITLQETAGNSGVFVGQVQITDGLPGGAQVLGKIGDTITVKYIDPLGNNGIRRTITLTARIGTAVPKTQQVPASAPAIVDSQGRPLTAVRAGDLVNIQTRVTNNDTLAHTFTYLVQVKDSTGVVVNLAWIRDIELGAGSSTSPAMSWIPGRAGTYTVEVFIWESLTQPIALSPAQKITATVG